MTPKWLLTLRKLSANGPGVRTPVDPSMTGHHSARALTASLRFLHEVGAVVWVEGTYEAAVTPLGIRLAREV